MEKKKFFKLIMQEFRCPNCNRLLFKSKMFGDYYLEVKCPRCKKVITTQRKTKD